MKHRLAVLGAVLAPVACASYYDGPPTDEAAGTGGQEPAPPDGTGGAGGAGGSVADAGPGGVPADAATTDRAASGTGVIHVEGTRIVDATGNPLVLHGVNFSGTEYYCIKEQGIFAGANDDAAVLAMAAWNIDSVRIPLNETCWLGINGVSASYAGAVYKSSIKKYVDRLTAHGIVSILELHWTAAGSQKALAQTPMPDRDHAVDFWKDVAATFKDSAATVVLDPFNEPWPDNNHDSEAAWTCWRDGGTCAGVDFTAAGMQELVSAIRAAGAKNLLLLGGVQWAGSLTGWAAHKPVDPDNNLAAAWHAYPDSACGQAPCWNAQMAPVASSVPLIVAEIGDKGCAPMIATLMPWLDQKHVGYLAWTWNLSKETMPCLDLITDYVTGAPTAQGLVYKNHILALP